MIVAGDVAGGEHAGDDGLERRSHRDAAVRASPVPAMSSGAGSRAHPHDRDVASSAPPLA